MPTDQESSNAYKQRKRPRKNTSRACDACKGRKTRCDGAQPCAKCRLHGRECRYDAPYLRSQVPPQPMPAVIDEEVDDGEGGGRLVSGVNTDDADFEEEEGFLGSSSYLTFTDAASVGLSNDQSSGEIISGVVPTGPSPDLIDLQRKRERRRRLYFGEPPFTELNLATYSLPSTEHGLEMIGWYFDNACPTYRFLHRPTVQRLVREFCQPAEWLGGGVDRKKMDTGDQCIVLMCWALGCQYPVPRTASRCYSPRERNWIHEKGQDYYQAAKQCVEKEKRLLDRLSIVQVRFLMSWYLATTSRLKEAWDLFAVVKNMANNLDLYRASPAGSSISRESSLRKKQSLGKSIPPDKEASIMKAERMSASHNELRNRTFWSIYIMDTHLSAMLGRNLSFNERDIQIPYSVMDDGDLEVNDNSSDRSRNDQHVTSQRPSLMIVPSLHAKLSHIVRRALRKLYLDSGSRYDVDAVSILGAELEEWEQDWPDFVDSKAHDDLSLIYARQRASIKLAKLQTVITIYRESLPLSSLTNSPESCSSSPRSESIHEHQERCLAAAIEAHEILMKLLAKGGITGSHWNSAYLSFGVATVMLVYVGQNARTLTSQRRQELLEYARQSIDVQRKISPNNFLARRYLAALEALSSQLKTRMASIPDSPPIGNIVPLPMQPLDPTMYSSDNIAMTWDSVYPTNSIDTSYYAGDPAVMPYLGTPSSMDMDGMGYTMESLFPTTYENSSFFDLDSLVAGGGFIYGQSGF